MTKQDLIYFVRKHSTVAKFEKVMGKNSYSYINLNEVPKWKIQKLAHSIIGGK